MPAVVVGMSGGVDSSVAAALLVEQGYDVIGIMLKLWSEPGRECVNRCCTPDSMAQARHVAAHLGIPFYVVDAKELFYSEVVEDFIQKYAEGNTPNPCLICNRKIRWGFLLERARLMGADYFATGHYARIKKEGDRYQLLEGIDKNKDQSYVLSVLNQDQLAHSLFPLGELTKPEVRQIAHQLNLSVADKEESQDLCFLGDGDYRQFLQKHFSEGIKSGDIFDKQGIKIGEHEGLAFYTIGQRKGIRIAAKAPLYVIEKDLAKNALIVGTREQLGSQNLRATQVNWISGNSSEQLFRAEVKIRYKATKVWCTIKLVTENEIEINFDEPQRDITPGQSVVMYAGESCLGSGIIKESF